MAPLTEGDPGREPVQIVEIDQDLCGREYGVTYCTAAVGVTGAHHCYHTRKTCQVPAAFWNQSTLTLRFTKPQAGPGISVQIPATQDAHYTADPLSYHPGLHADRATAPLPFLVSVSSTPTRINVGGRAGRTGSLGQRSSVTITMQDAPHSDLMVDPHLEERTWNPLDRGTFWSKWLARNPYYTGRACRVFDGYLGQTLDEMKVRHYVLDKIEGPDTSGKVTIRAMDVLRLADNDVAKAPALSTGKVKTKVYATDIEIEVEGAASTDYSTSVIRIGDELIAHASFFYVGGVTTFIYCVRGFMGTTAADHEVGAEVQEVLYLSSQAWEAVRDLIVDWTSIPGEYIDDAAWQAEAEKWNGNYLVDRVITTPTGVSELLGELCEQGSITIWWDETAQLIRLRAIRPPLPAEVLQLSEDTDLIQGATRLTVRPEERLSQVWISWDMRSPLLPKKERGSYLRTRARVDLEAEGEDFYGVRKVYEIFSPWLVSDAQATILSYRLLAAYRDDPPYIAIAVDAKDRDEVVPGAISDITWRGFVDETGAPETRRYQVVSVDEVEPGTMLRAELQPSQFTGRYAYVMADTAGTYSSYSEIPDLAGFASPPDIAGDAEDFPDNTTPYVAI